MTGWDVLNDVIAKFPPVVLALLLVIALVAAVILVAGFSKHGLDFLKHGFKQTSLGDLASKLATKEDIDKLNAKIEAIEVNHFGHLKNFLTELTSILLDKGIINNENKARLDNQLRGM
jgi:hypothetical protein